MTSSAAVATARAPRLAPTILAAWFVLAALVGASGRLLALPFPIPQLLILVLTAAALVIGFRVDAVRAWIDGLPLRAMAGVHSFRVVAGVWFLILASQGALSVVFAQRAGWGDIASGALAIGLLLSGNPSTTEHRRWYFLWNILGLTDFAVVLWTAAWIGGTGVQPGVQPLLTLPLSLLPTFFVPALIASHVFIFRRLAAPALPR